MPRPPHAPRAALPTPASPSAPRRLRASLRALLCALLCACGGGAGGARSGEGGEARAARLVVALDLGAEQEGGAAWARRVAGRASEALAPLGVRLEVARFVSLDSSDGARALPLEAVRARVAALRAASPRPAGELWLAVTSFPPASFPRLSDLALARPLDPALALRRLSGLGGLEEGAEESEARLLARSVAAALGAAEGCERDALTLSRDELLGGRAAPEGGARAPREGDAPLPATPLGRGAPPRPGAPEAARAGAAPLAPLALAPLTFSPRNVALTRAAAPCARLALLDRACPAQQPAARVYAHACYHTAEGWAGALRRGELDGEAWAEERALGRGAEAAL
ncbi:MAG: hypothetical protein FJ138_07275, partial [Deltaproteobacteria bacterium]|nr:hypothetical protein [Deltaproteobacteria bacterium]